MRYTLARLFLTCFVCQLALLPSTDADYTTYRSLVLTKVNNWVTSFITTSQFVTILNYLEPKIQSNSTMSGVESDAMTIVMSTLTTSQMLQGASVASGFMFSFGGYTVPLNITEYTLIDNWTPFIGQLRAMKLKAETQGWPNDKTFTRAYQMINIFFTYRCVNIIYCRLQGNLDASNTKYWPYFKSNLASYIKISAMNYTAGHCYP